MKIFFVIDCQNDFITGSLGNEAALNTVPYIVEEIKKKRSSGWEIYYTQDTHQKDYLETFEGKLLPIEHCIENSWGWEITDEIKKIFDYGDTFIIKNTFGAFNTLSEIIKGDIEEVELCGFCTSICVAANAIILRALKPDLKISINRKLCADVSPENHEAGLKVMAAQQINILN